MKKEPSLSQLESAEVMFRALADLHRLQTIVRISKQERSVSELAAMSGEKIATVSARLKVLLAGHLVTRRREGQNIFYKVADVHVLNLIENAVEHAAHK